MDVFVVEDSAPMRRRVVEALEELPGVCVVGVADSADEAVPAITSLTPHFVVVDLKLAQGSGLFVLETIRHLDPPPVVAVLTNYPHEQYRARCAEMGAEFFFDKAAGLDGLLEACRRACGVAEDQRVRA